MTVDYFRDEVRNGFFVPTAIKQAWGAQLKVLEVIDTICRKHDITYFADWGTLLGTVRHGGYVPWDDDMDICMKRADYEKFRQAAANELPGNYCIHDYEHKEDHWLFLARVVNNEHISYEKEHMDEFYNFPYLVGIDIFVLDYLYRDDKAERARCEEVKCIIAVADAIVNNKINAAAKAANLAQFEQRYNVTFSKCADNRQLGIELYRLAEKQMARVPEEESDSLGQIFPWILKGNKGRDKKLFDKIIRLPFENTTMPVPADYNYMLKSKYDRYFVIKKVWDGHKYPFFEAQRESLQAVADFKLPEFTFDQKKLRINRQSNSYRNTMQEIVRDAADELVKLSSTLDDADDAACADVLVQCQQAAIDIGNYIEKVLGEDNPSCKAATASIAEYCEVLFQLYSAVTDQSSGDGIKAAKENGSIAQNGLYDSYMSALADMLDAVKNEITDKKIVAFLPDNPERWHELQPLYDHYKYSADTEVCVIPLPVLVKNLYGEIVSDEAGWNNDRMEEYPEELNLVRWDSIDMHMFRFDAVIIQNPYDEWNPYLTVPSAFYSDRLARYTDCLIYVMPDGVNDFTENDITDMYGLKYSLAMPGAVYADRILIHSENMKPLYADYLAGFAAGTSADDWNGKLMVYEEMSGAGEAYAQMSGTGEAYADVSDTDKAKNIAGASERKKLLYCIGENEFAEDGGSALENISRRLQTMLRYADKLDIVVCTYPYKLEDWDICTEEQKREFAGILGEAFRSGSVSFSNFRDVDVKKMTAYYGSPSPLICRFIEQHRPVMLSASQNMQ